MSDDNSPSNQGSSGKTWLGAIAQMFQGEPQSKKELVEVIEDAQHRELIDSDTQKMIQGVLGVSELKVRDIMIPRSQMITLNVDKPLAELLPLMVEASHSRFPVISEDKDHIEATQAAIREGRTYLYQQLDKLGLSYVRSQSNFMVVHVGDAKKIADDLAKQNVHVRNADRNWGVKNHVRVSIGTREENEAFINTLRQISG